jgi:uncharacterized protein YkvS
MSNTQLPVNTFNDSPQSNPAYSVVRQDDDLVYVSAVGTDTPIYVGNILQFKEGLRGYVQAIDSNGLAVVKIFTDYEPLSYAETLKFLDIPVIDLKAFVPLTELGQLKVFCKSGDYKSVGGQIGWSLYKDDVLLAIGNDANNKSMCELNGLGIWEEGNYRLVIRRFDADTLQPISQATRVIRLTESQSLISIGDATDESTKVFLI